MAEYSWDIHAENRELGHDEDGEPLQTEGEGEPSTEEGEGNADSRQDSERFDIYARNRELGHTTDGEPLPVDREIGEVDDGDDHAQLDRGNG
jgi:hypothetical protein